MDEGYGVYLAKNTVVKPVICSRLLHARTCIERLTPAKPKLLVLPQTAESHGWQDVFRVKFLVFDSSASGAEFSCRKHQCIIYTFRPGLVENCRMSLLLAG